MCAASSGGSPRRPGDVSDREAPARAPNPVKTCNRIGARSRRYGVDPTTSDRELPRQRHPLQRADGGLAVTVTFEQAKPDGTRSEEASPKPYRSALT
jgi:hypothetical protein